MNMRPRGIIAVLAAVVLAACGGGGGGGESAPVALSETQKNFETTTKNDYYVSLSWYVPSTDVAPTSGIHYFYYLTDSVATSPKSGAVQSSETTVNLATTLALPPPALQSVTRVLKNGAIHVSNEATKEAWSYSGSDVVLTLYATDGTTVVNSAVFDDWSAPIPLSGPMGSNAIMQSYLGFTLLNEPQNFDFSKDWLAGSSYFTRKGYSLGTVLFLGDWTNRTYDAAVDPFPGPQTTIETMFGAYSNGITVNGVTYTVASGSISTIEGARVWVATEPKPASASPTTSYVAFAELNGKIYYGTFRKAGTRFKSFDGMDPNIVDDYVIRLNSHAAQSLKQAIKF